jgi:hypothetical protein
MIAKPSEMLPCPFCGSPAQVLGSAHFVACCSSAKCNGCPRTPLFSEKNDAIAAWNRRPPSSEQAGDWVPDIRYLAGWFIAALGDIPDDYQKITAEQVMDALIKNMELGQSAPAKPCDAEVDERAERTAKWIESLSHAGINEESCYMAAALLRRLARSEGSTPASPTRPQRQGRADARFLGTKYGVGFSVSRWPELKEGEEILLCTQQPASQDRAAYESAREDLLDWRGRAQRAEARLRSMGYQGIDASEPPTQPASQKATVEAITKAISDYYYRVGSFDHFNFSAAAKAVLNAIEAQPASAAVAAAEVLDYRWAYDPRDKTHHSIRLIAHPEDREVAKLLAAAPGVGS